MTNPAREKAVNYLSRFSRTRRQIADYLKKKEFDQVQIADALDYLQEHNYLNDDRFAENYILEKIRKKDGPLKIRQMLYQKGIDSRKSDELLRINYPVELQEENAASLIFFKMRGKSPQALDRNSREKILRFVASRGFPRYVIIQAFKSASAQKE